MLSFGCFRLVLGVSEWIWWFGLYLLYLRTENIIHILIYMFGGFNKFGACKEGGFDSKAEKVVAEKFGMLEKAGLIRGLRRCAVHFLIIPEISHTEVIYKQLKTKVKRIEKKVIEEKEARYTPDFFYYDCETSEYVMLEVKSFITKRQADYPLRRKLMKHIINEHNAKGRGQWRFEEIEI